MSLTSRRRRPLDRAIPHLRDTRLVVIATEGARTEKQYFTIFQGRNSRVQVHVLPTAAGASSPAHVLDRLREYRRQYDLGRGDVLCLVIDTDRWPDKQLGKVAAAAFKCNFVLAVTRPCFELWLFLHHADPVAGMDAMNSNQIEAELRALLGGYDKSNLQPAKFEPHVQRAAERAIVLDVRPEDRWPNRLGTRVYRVVQAINERAETRQG